MARRFPMGLPRRRWRGRGGLPGGFSGPDLRTAGRRLPWGLRPSHLRLIAAIILAVLAAFGLLPPGELKGPAEVVDGDTLLVGGERVRLWGIDAPELEQPCRRGGACGQRARAHLAQLTAWRSLICDKRGSDRYGREVAQCFVAKPDGSGKADGENADIGRAMVRAGQAMAYRDITTRYVADEPGRYDFEPPWEWRERQQARNEGAQ